MGEQVATRSPLPPPPSPASETLVEVGGTLKSRLINMVSTDVTARVDLATMRLFLAHPKKGGANTILHLTSNAAFFERRDGRYVLTALLILLPKFHNKQWLRVLTEGMLTMYHDGGMSSTNYKHRRRMKVTGHRDARNGGIGHYRVKHQLRSAEALGCLMASLAGLVLVAPYLAGALCKHVAGALNVGGNIWASMWPFSLLAVTVDYENESHEDPTDLGKSFLCWLEKGKVSGGEFVLDEYGVEFTPRNGSVLWMDCATISHYTKGVVSKNEGSTRVGLGLALKKKSVTGLKNWRAEQEAEERDLLTAIEEMQLFLGPKDISEKMMAHSSVQAALDLYEELAYDFER